MIRVDAHHHVWRVARGDYGWLTPDLPIHRDCTLDDLRPLLGDITTTVLVQAPPTQAETAFMLEVARGSAGLSAAHRDAPAHIAALAGEPLLKDLRPMLQDIADTDWILRADIEPAISALIAAGLRFDALVQPRHLRMLLELCARHPALRLVIDHGAKPAIATRAWQPWADDIAHVARETPALCKLSGLVTEAGQNWRVDDLRRYVEHLIVCFGPDRLLWGSDWPVVNLAGGYARWREATATLLAVLPERERDAILGGTALEFYDLTRH